MEFVGRGKPICSELLHSVFLNPVCIYLMLQFRLLVQFNAYTLISPVFLRTFYDICKFTYFSGQNHPRPTSLPHASIIIGKIIGLRLVRFQTKLLSASFTELFIFAQSVI